MAKRKSTQPTPEQRQAALIKRRELLLKLVWAIIAVVIILYGYTKAYPLVVSGQLWWGIFMGLAYSGGALLLILGALYLNRKMKGL
jgi:hypothetical protein